MSATSGVDAGSVPRVKFLRLSLEFIVYVATLIWVAFTLAGPVGESTSFVGWIAIPLLLTLAYLPLAMLLVVVIHETAHAAVLLGLRRTPVIVTIGVGKQWAATRSGPIQIRLRGVLASGGLTQGPRPNPRWQWGLFAAAGPAANVLTAAVVAAFWDLQATPFAATVVVFSLLLGVLNLIPGPGSGAGSGKVKHNDGRQLLDVMRGRDRAAEESEDHIKALTAMAEEGDHEPLIDFLTQALKATRKPEERQRLLVARSASLNHAERYVEAAKDGIEGKANRSDVADSIAAAMLLGDLPANPKDVAELVNTVEAVSDSTAGSDPLVIDGLTHTRAMVALLKNEPGQADRLLKTVRTAGLPQWARTPVNGTRVLTAVSLGDTAQAALILADLRLDAPRSRWTAASDEAVTTRSRSGS